MKLSKASGIYFLGRLIPALIGFLTIPIYTKLLGIYEYGTFSLYMGGISIASILTTGWLEPTVIRFVNQNAKDNGVNAKAILVLMITSYAVFLSGLAIGSMLLADTIFSQNSIAFLSAIPAFLAISSFRPLINIYRSYEKPGHYSLLMTAFSILRFITAIILLTYVKDIAANIFIAYFVTGMILILFPIRTFLSVSKNSPFKKSVGRDLLSYGLPYLPLMSATWIFTMFNRFVIEHYHGREMVGAYSAAFNISEQSIGFLYSAIMMALFPRLVSEYERLDFAKVKKTLENGLELYFIIILPAAVGFGLVAEQLLNVLSTDEFQDAGRILPILGFNTALIGFNQYLSKSFELKKQTPQLMKIFLIGAVINTLLSFPMIKAFGMTGAALGSSITFIILAIILRLSSTRILQFSFPLMTLFKVIVASSIMSLVLIMISHVPMPVAISLISRVVGGVVVYSIVSYVLGLHRVLGKI